MKAKIIDMNGKEIEKDLDLDVNELLLKCCDIETIISKAMIKKLKLNGMDGFKCGKCDKVLMIFR